MLYPYTETQRIVLRPAETADGAEIYHLLLRLGLNSLPRLDEFVATFDHGAAAIFAIHLRHDNQVVGFGTIQQLDPDGHVQVGIFTDAERAKYGIGGEAMMLLINYAFATWTFVRKVYFLTTEASMGAFGSALATVPREATLPEHVYFAGKLWDLHWYAVYRDGWEEQTARLVSRLAEGPRFIADADAEPAAL